MTREQCKCWEGMRGKETKRERRIKDERERNVKDREREKEREKERESLEMDTK